MPSCRADGLRGIYNAGATCYQNVILQSFLHNPILRNFYLSDGHSSSNCEVPHCLSCAMDDMFQDFWGSEVTNGYTAANILSSFWISENKAFENLVTTKEQDAHEFFQFLAEELHERNGDGKRPETGSEHSCNCIIHQTYYGKLQTTTTCQNCGGVTNQVQSFLDLSVGLENLAQKRGKKASHGKTSMTLQECLEDEYVKSDKCEYRCNKCDGTQQARRNTSIKRLPNVLSIQLKVHIYNSSSFILLYTIFSDLQGCACELTDCDRSGLSSEMGPETSPQPKSRRRSISPCSLTCCPTQIALGTRMRRRHTSYRGRAPTISCAPSCTLAKSTPAITSATVVWVNR